MQSGSLKFLLVSAFASIVVGVIAVVVGAVGLQQVAFELPAGVWTAGIVVAASLPLLLVLMIFIARIAFKAAQDCEFYVSILDAVEMPISVTDKNMNWTFVNRAVEQMINVDRNTVYGMHCSNWNADICNTEKCGIARFKKGFKTSDFVNAASDHYYRTTVCEIKDRKGRQDGFIEIVSDVDAEIRIKQIAAEVASAVENISESASQVASASQSLSQGATEQASSLEEITSSTEEINSQTSQNAESSQEATKIANQASTDAGKGDELMSELISAMHDINSSSEDIRKVVKVVDDIAFQINLLALNANVEAARAGKYGKGFAVVAEEVRNLAARSAESAKETGSMVEQTIQSITRGNESAEQTSQQLKAIVDGASRVATLLSEIATASREQAEGLTQIQSGLDQIDQVTQANTASAEESASASEELASQAVQLKQLVARFNGDETSGGEADSQVRQSSSGQIEKRRQEAPRQLAAS